MSSTANSAAERWYLLFAVLAVGGVVLVVVGYGKYVVPELFGKLEPEDLAYSKGKTVWAAASALVLVALLWNGALGWATVKDVIDRGTGGKWWKYGLAILASILLIPIAWCFYGRDFGGGIVDVLIDQLRKEDVRRILMAVGTNNAAAACMIYTLVVASFWLGVASRTATEVDLCRYQRQFKMLLWTTSAILALAIVQVSLLHLWGAGQFEKTFASDATATAKAITISFGLLASGTGCAIFLPVAIVQRRRLDELLEQEMNKEKGKRKRKDILEEWGFEDVGAGQFLVNHIAVLAPLATALLARALE